MADGTADGSAYARITITDLFTGAVLRDTTYTNGAGSCCTAVTYIARDAITINSRLFRVRTETREFSGTHRYYGCEDFGTGNPPTSQIGMTQSHLPLERWSRYRNRRGLRRVTLTRP